MISSSAEPIPAISAEQMREVDRIMVEDLGIEMIQMMENAGRSLADLAIDRFKPATVLVLAGSGGNGGGGMVCARHLSNRGVDVSVVLSRPGEDLAGVPALQHEILQRMRVSIATDPTPADLVVDALIGYSLQGAPRGRAAELIRWVDGQTAPVLALDAPSGVDVTTGETSDPHVEAAATLTLALPKQGLIDLSAAGEHYLADISVPVMVYDRIGVRVSETLFAESRVVRVD